MGLIDEVGAGPVALDTCVFIYYIEEHPAFLPIVEPVFKAVDRGKLQAVTSDLTLLEVLVVPYRMGDVRLAEKYEALLTRSRGLSVVGLSRSLLRGAARIRAAAGLKTPDAIQVATALAAGCTSLVTADRNIPDIGGLRIVDLAAAHRREP
jgi:predicted nucleic acid-binding protein